MPLEALWLGRAVDCSSFAKAIASSSRGRGEAGYSTLFCNLGVHFASYWYEARNPHIASTHRVSKAARSDAPRHTAWQGGVFGCTTLTDSLGAVSGSANNTRASTMSTNPYQGTRAICTLCNKIPKTDLNFPYTVQGSLH